jgi:enterochelin esterase-like enzyme
MSRAGRLLALLLPGLLAALGTGDGARAGVTGTVLTLDSLRAPGLLPRPVQLWLPPGWEDAGELPLIVAHDGQNLFDAATSFSGVDWNLDGQLDSLIRAGLFRPVAVAAVGNTAQRRRDYMPDDLFRLLSPQEQDSFRRAFGGGPLGHAYLDALADSLLPALRRRFPLARRPEETVLLGSSRGALISVAGLARHPELFGRAYALSTHWPAAGGALVPWLAQALPEPAGRTLYLDRGDATLDALYPTLQARADSLLAAAGWQEGGARISRAFPGDPHHESAWRRRVAPALAGWLGSPPFVR